ncbi:MAG: cytochrome c biogenesis protein CcdA [Lachnospiraceae bacterium]|nr:cytochrome c biogenesis protein CcdA [Lachnospiraceae bacterium]
MQYFISFLEGIITFLSPCLLPMLPIYLFYFAGGKAEEKKGTTLKNALGFVLGFTIVFTLMGAFAGVLGGLLRKYQTAVNVVSGLIVICFGLHYLGLFKKFWTKGTGVTANTENLGFGSSLVFGMVFSVGWTPCVGAFLGSALMLASQQGSVITGVIMLLCYSMGLGIPFVVSAVLIDRLKGTFQWVKEHYGLLNKIAGLFLVLIGILMMTGTMGRLLALLS